VELNSITVAPVDHKPVIDDVYTMYVKNRLIDTKQPLTPNKVLLISLLKQSVKFRIVATDPPEGIVSTGTNVMIVTEEPEYLVSVKVVKSGDILESHDEEKQITDKTLFKIIDGKQEPYALAIWTTKKMYTEVDYSFEEKNPEKTDQAVKENLETLKPSVEKSVYERIAELQSKPKTDAKKKSWLNGIFK
jgi:1,2-phenylacetyl-CoA epoxidase PaaB subunit